MKNNKQQQSARDVATDTISENAGRPNDITLLHNELCSFAREIGIDLGSSEWPHLSLFRAIKKRLTAAKGESVTVKAEPPPRDLAQNIAKCSTYDLFFAADEALRNDTEPWFLTDAKALLAEPQQPDPATPESTATWKGVDADEFLDELRREDGDIEYIDQLESTDADKGVCECGHPEIDHSDVAGIPNNFCRGGTYGNCPCFHFKPATPPASELSRGAVFTAIHLLPTEFDGIHTWIRKDIVINKLVQFPGQRAEVAHEHNALCTVAYNDGQRAERAKVAALKIALADAIRCPMGVCPDSAVGLLTVEELKDAENRRIEGKSPAIKHIGLTGDQNER